MKTIFLLILLATFAFAFTSVAASAPATSNDSTQIEMGPVRINTGPSEAIVFLFGVFCALWAQNTNRNPWLWFFLGLFFNVITVFVLLYKNSKDRYASALALTETEQDAAANP